MAQSSWRAARAASKRWHCRWTQRPETTRLAASHHPDPSGSNNLLEILAAVHSRHASNSDASSAPRNVGTRSDADSTIDDVVMSDAFHQWSEKFELRFHHKVFAARA